MNPNHVTNIITNNCRAIHYSCGKFGGPEGNTTASIVSISIQDFNGSSSETFSIHLVAEDMGYIGKEQILNNYDVIEAELLRRFYTYVEQHPNSNWMSWNMDHNSTTFGFAHIKRRAQQLNVLTSSIPQNQCHELSRCLRHIYGKEFANHGLLNRGRFWNLMRLNAMSFQNIIPGKKEPQCFHNGRFDDVHRSTESKSKAIRHICHRVRDGTLKTGSVWTSTNWSFNKHDISIYAGIMANIKSIIGF